MHLGHHIRHPRQHILRTQRTPRRLNGLSEATPVPRRLADCVRDQRGRLGNVQLQAASPTRPRQLGRTEQQQPVALRGGQSHRRGSRGWIRAGALGAVSSGMTALALPLGMTGRVIWVEPAID
ncbi:hypothetical protein GZL_00448 [Streptomyces sp. 769]|nr:hypothetical protein GZL_00448 [Streptomyces sp. 769]